MATWLGNFDWIDVPKGEGRKALPVFLFSCKSNKGVEHDRTWGQVYTKGKPNHKKRKYRAERRLKHDTLRHLCEPAT